MVSPCYFSILRVVAREVSSDPKEYSDVFLGMPNAAYCSWIMNRTNWCDTETHFCLPSLLFFNFAAFPTQLIPKLNF